MRMANRVEAFGIPHYKGVTKKTKSGVFWSGNINRSSDRQFNKPNTIKNKSLIFVNSMSDFFHKNANYKDMVDAIDIMSKTDHYYQVLTKRPENIKKFLNDTGVILPDNLWIGVSVESKKVTWRINVLKNIKSSVKFISFEPLIGCIGNIDLSGIDWAISGGESGAKSRPMEYDWVNNINSLCNNHNIPHFFKQWGSWTNNPLSVNGKQFILDNDSIGKGGSLLNGEYIKNMPLLYK